MKSFYKGQKIATTIDLSISPHLFVPLGIEGVVETIGAGYVYVAFYMKEEPCLIKVYPEEIQDLSEYTLGSI